MNKKIFICFLLYACFNSGYAMSPADRQEINGKLSLFGMAWSGGVESLEEHFIVHARIHEDRYELDLIFRQPPKVKRTFIIDRKKVGMKSGGMSFPNVPELSAADLGVVSDVFSKHGKLWMMSPSNNKVVVFDLSGGPQSLTRQDLFPHYPGAARSKLSTRRDQNFAILYYQGEYGGFFSIWVDLEKKIIAGANWVEFPMGVGGMLSPANLRFIDRSLRENGDFGVYGRVTEGMESLVENFSVILRDDDEHGAWYMSVLPFDGHGHELGFWIDKTTGDVSHALVGHSVPASF